MKKAKFIINSAITQSEKLNHLESIIGCLVLNQIVNQVDVVYTSPERNAMMEAECIKPGEYDFVTVVGGDGTVHDVINGIIASGSMTPVAIISTGTSNSFANYMGLPTDRVGFCKMIKKMTTVGIEAGQVNDKFFINSVVGGFLTKGVSGASQQSKDVFGKMAYIIGAARMIRKSDDRSAKIRYTSKEFSGVVDTSVFVVKNISSLSSKDKDPLKSLNDGYLEVMIIESAGMLDIPSLLVKFMQGTDIHSQGIKNFKTKAIDIAVEEGASFQLEFDKEKYGKLPVHLEPVKDAFRLIIP